MKRIISFLIISVELICYSFGQASADGKFGNVAYNGEDFISVSIAYSYKFSGTRMHVYFNDITIGGYRKMTPQLQEALAKEGIKFPMKVSPSQVSFTFSGIVDFGQSHLRTHKYPISFRGGGSSNYSHIDPTQEVQKYASEYFKKYSRNFYDSESRFPSANVKVSDFVARELLQKIQSTESKIKREAETASTNNEASKQPENQTANQKSTQSKSNEISNKLGVQIEEKPGTLVSTASSKPANAIGSTSVKSVEQMRKEREEAERRRAQEMIHQAEIDRQRRDRQIQQSVTEITTGSTDMVTALSGMAGNGATHIIGINGLFLGGEGEGDDYNPSLLRAELFYRFQSSGRFAMIGEFGFGYGDLPAPASEEFNEFDENPGPGFSLAFGLGYKLLQSKHDKSNLMLGVQGGYSMYFAGEVADIAFPVVGFVDIAIHKLIYVGFFYGKLYPLGRDDTAFGQNRSTSAGGLKVGFSF